ncbi:MAG TPA: RpiB/LacA/LacB family sugar-phosphate isomerase [Candidatus Portnoybacteria bacterium]|jgi:ribose 5-phosphate isomerase B|nr:RpiB/LacA/LacB family sugar-phosphate isomerase [Candidatus Portnoybacteria bacterium]MDD5752104.1 RpiB/LacA/LacB family sugar-phosphate isomerase [Candidatus Portnoybacteria bacterium]HOZ16609.1 RpiB/LacA/LacB family sugar-phosphate isomerase [Candidatus Portnoybacteria bacterium]HPH52385.1 RpiB/LacA/LacB family sugar-phosphate isomerase [Candidatus Portnoybacteria bacterium]HPJ80340.1 RpiB/LacA/LacB family sugar-phosphate isomerase [Candidatus Portnoybacteria bacterium]
MIFLGADHGGFSFKEKIKEYLQEFELEFEDLGNLKFQGDDDFVDYATVVAKKVVDMNGKGILICTNGEGMCVAANKIKGIRAVSPTNKKAAQQTREHLNANILCLGEHTLSFREAKKIIKVWLETNFFNSEKYIRRLNKIKNLENYELNKMK